MEHKKNGNNISNLRELMFLKDSLNNTDNKIDFIEEQIEEITTYKQSSLIKEPEVADHDKFNVGINPIEEAGEIKSKLGGLGNEPYRQEIKEYDLVLESRDRNISKFPNPFEYKVYFNNTTGSGDANIPRIFEHVKYAKLDIGILPVNYFYTRNSISITSDTRNVLINLNITNNPKNSEFSLSGSDISGNFVVIDIVDEILDDRTNRTIKFCSPVDYPLMVYDNYEYTFSFNIGSGDDTEYPSYFYHFHILEKKLSDERYLLLHIDELENANENATNYNVSKAFSVMFRSGEKQEHFLATSKFNDKEYTFNELNKISKLTIKITDDDGNVLTNSIGDYTDISSTTSNNDSKNSMIFSGDTFKRNYSSYHTYFRHPLYKGFQNSIILKIGVVEVNINKKIFT